MLDIKFNKIRSYGRTKGRRKKSIPDDIIDSYKLDLDEFISCKNERNSNIFLDIGSGYGENIIQNALNNPDNIYIASDVYIDGILNTVYLAKKNNLKNINFLYGDIRNFLHIFPDFFFKKIWLLFPDPWHKKKHHKRRIFNSDFMDLILRKIKKINAELIIATDHQNYSEDIYQTIKSRKLYLKDNLFEFIFNKINKKNIKNEFYYSTKYHNKIHFDDVFLFRIKN